MVCASVAVTLVEMLYPDDGSGVRRALDLCLSLCLLVAVVAPIGGIIGDLRGKINESAFDFVIPEAERASDEVIFDVIEEEGQRQVEERLKELICERFELKSDRVSVTASIGVSEEGIALNRVTVRLSGVALMTDPREIKHLISEYTDAECEIVGGRP